MMKSLEGDLLCAFAGRLEEGRVRAKAQKKAA